MPVAVVTFVVCATTVLGVYWLFILGPEERAGRALRKRLKPDSEDRGQRPELARTAAPLSALKTLDALLARSGGVIDPIQRIIALSGLRVTVGVIVLAGGLVGMLTFLVVQLVTGVVWIAAGAALFAAPLPYSYVRAIANRRLRTLEEQFPQAIELIAVSLRAGHAFATGLLMVAEEIAAPMGTEFRLLYDQQNYGKPLPDVLKGLAERVPLLDVRIFVTAVLTQRETGGNLAEVLDRLAALVRERFTIRRQVQSVSAHGRITGWVLAFMPPAVAGMLFVVAPDHVRILVEDPVGLQLVAAGLFLQIVGTLAIRRIVDIEI